MSSLAVAVFAVIADRARKGRATLRQDVILSLLGRPGGCKTQLAEATNELIELGVLRTHRRWVKAPTTFILTTPIEDEEGRWDEIPAALMDDLAAGVIKPTMLRTWLFWDQAMGWAGWTTDTAAITAARCGLSARTIERHTHALAAAGHLVITRPGTAVVICRPRPTTTAATEDASSAPSGEPRTEEPAPQEPVDNAAPEMSGPDKNPDTAPTEIRTPKRNATPDHATPDHTPSSSRSDLTVRNALGEPGRKRPKEAGECASAKTGIDRVTRHDVAAVLWAVDRDWWAGDRQRVAYRPAVAKVIGEQLDAGMTIPQAARALNDWGDPLEGAGKIVPNARKALRVMATDLRLGLACGECGAPEVVGGTRRCEEHLTWAEAAQQPADLEAELALPSLQERVRAYRGMGLEVERIAEFDAEAATHLRAHQAGAQACRDALRAARETTDVAPATETTPPGVEDSTIPQIAASEAPAMTEPLVEDRGCRVHQPRVERGLELRIHEQGKGCRSLGAHSQECRGLVRGGRGRAKEPGVSGQVFAHSPGVRRPGRWHGLGEHSLGTAQLAGEFGEAFGMGETCHALGLFHDAGKAGCVWQQRLREVAALPGRVPVGIDHKQAGAHLVLPALGSAALAILGHHSGLPDADPRPLATLDAHELAQVRARFLAEVPHAGEVFPLPPGRRWQDQGWAQDLAARDIGMRLMFSALVDADHLDTAAHFAGHDAPMRGVATPMPVLLERFLHGRQRILAGRTPSPVDEVRGRIFDWCLDAAQGQRGIYRLPAPTGSGKTLSAAGFALAHAARHRMRRVVVAVPFTTITEQNAQVYRDLLGDAVIEHHSDVTLDRRSRACENWDAPFVVTTTVQLFDSLFGRRPGRSRKVHRLAGAVIVLDEVQALPEAVLPVILSGLRVLVEHFGATVLLASATQPTFEAIPVWRDQAINGIGDPGVDTYALLRRVDYEWATYSSWGAVADAVAEQPQALVIVNTTAAARDLALDLRARRDDVLHLSTRMCPAHRRRVLAEVRERLDGGLGCVVVATQVVEAGVDLDFPVVFRAGAPAEALQQAAGRANREGRLGRGRVVVFEVQGDASGVAVYRSALGHSREFFGPGKADPDDVVALGAYYGRHYRAVALESQARVRSIAGARAGLNFHTVAEGPARAGGGRDASLAFRMLPEESVSLVVPGYDARAQALLEELRGDCASAVTVRALQPFVVSVRRSVAGRAHVAARIEWLDQAGEVGVWQGPYEELFGLDDREVVA